jgi:hypothetical protein
MKRKLLAEILAAHADQLVNGQADDHYRDLFSTPDEDILPLLGVAELVNSTMKPVSIPRKFELDLKQQLLATAQQHQAQGYRPPHPFKDLLVVLAAFTFVVSLAAVFFATRFNTAKSNHVAG